MAEDASLPCDLDGDDDCDSVDLELFNRALGTCANDPNYHPAADDDGDGCVDSSDREYLFTDDDADGAPNDADQSPDSELGATVVIDSCDSGVTNTLLSTGCTISDLIAQCVEGASNHGKLVSCVAHLTNDLKKDGLITGQQKGAIQSCAAQADIPKKGGELGLESIFLAAG
jgi:hypothetical protein